jgi:hypothetical protein
MHTGFGTAAIRWERDGDLLTVDMSVPAGAHGVFMLPRGWRAAEESSRGQQARLSAGHHRVVLTAASGDDARQR